MRWRYDYQPFGERGASYKKKVYAHDPFTNISNIYSTFCSNSEASASELLQGFEEMFLRGDSNIQSN